MGVDVSTFSSLHTTGFAQCWYETPEVPHNDVSVHGNPWPNQRSLDAAGALGLVLHYLSSTMHAISLQKIFAIIPSTLLLCTLCTIQDAKIQWPGGLDFEHCSELVVAWVVIAARLNALGRYYIVADTAFPHGSNNIQGQIRAPLKQGQHIQGSLAEIDEQMVFNCELLSYQQTAEWVGINQIWTVYLKHWQETDDDIAVWNDFENMLFSEQRQKD
ncbi:hypothetical protein BDR03DRAFT_936193 [Suillus americanus]|nr:hypothetical protein BDR03DRAFT_936193 [Suillus americanus]